jgi:hypothetical protein
MGWPKPVWGRSQAELIAEAIRAVRRAMAKLDTPSDPRSGTSLDIPAQLQVAAVREHEAILTIAQAVLRWMTTKEGAVGTPIERIPFGDDWDETPSPAACPVTRREPTPWQCDGGARAGAKR